MLGKGYLYKLVVNFSWLGAIPIAVYLLLHWKPEILRTYRNSYPESAIAKKIDQSEKTGLAITAAAFVLITGRWVRLSFNDIFSQFKLTRKIFAYLFRRQLEKKANALGRPEVDVTLLPEKLQKAFEEIPVLPETSIDYFPHLNEVRALLKNWKEGGQGLSVALVGETGIGRTSWLNELMRTEPMPEAIRAAIEHGAFTEADLCRMLCNTLDVSEVLTVEQLVSALLSGPRKAIVLDQCQNLVFRSVGGMVGFNAFAEVIGRTVPHLFWICSFTKYAWEYSESDPLTNNIFRIVYYLKPWDESIIEKLIDKRMELAGFQASYEDLIVDRVDGTEFESEVIRTGERYRQLLWDYSDGIPRVALHFWLRSLVASGDSRMKVRLFAAPSADALEGLNEQSRFVLGALVIHQNLTVEEASRVLNFPVHVCRLILHSLTEGGYADASDGHYHISSHWHRAVVRYLRRKHLLYT